MQSVTLPPAHVPDDKLQRETYKQDVKQVEDVDLRETTGAEGGELKHRDAQENAIYAESFELGLTNWQALKLYRKVRLGVRI